MNLNKNKDMEMKELYANERTGNRFCGFSKVVAIDGKKFKITHDTANCYSRTKIFVQLPTLEWGIVATEFDLGGCYINYVEDEDKMSVKMSNIYKKCIDYIVNVIL